MVTEIGLSKADKSKPYFPLAGSNAEGRYSHDKEATATCFCGSVQMAFPTEGEGLVSTFVCHCSDCHKFSATMFASNFTTKDSHTRFIRGEDNLSTYGESETIGSGHIMTNHFCKTCGSLMFRVGGGFPVMRIMRIGTVDDFVLHETKLRPQVEYFVENRVDWLKPIEGAKQLQGMGQPKL